MAAPHEMTEDDTPPDPRRWVALAVLLLAGFVNLMDVTIVNVALPSLQRNLQASSSDIEWIVAGYVLAFALFLLPSGRLGDIIGRKMMFLGGISGFTLLSAMCGMAPSIEWLVAARVLQGISAAVMMPQVLAIAQVTFPRHERGLAFSLFGLNSGLAAMAGPLIGGLLISADIAGLDWRPIFLVNVPIGIFAVVAGAVLIPNIKGNKALEIDWIGMGLAGIAVFLLIFPLVEGRQYGWPVWAYAMMGAALFVVLLFYFWERGRERTGKAELLPMHLMRNRNFAIGVLMTMALFSGMPSFFMVFALFLQTGFGFTPLESGLTTMPMPIGLFLASILAGILGARGLKVRVATGMVLVLSAYLILRAVLGGIGDEINHWWFAPPLLMMGFGMGTTIAPLFQSILSAVPGRDAGSASGTLQSFQQLGGACGVAIAGEMFFSRLGDNLTHQGFTAALLHETTYQLIAFSIVLVLLPLQRRLPATASAAKPVPMVEL